jgi:hypothetical protein
MVIDRDTKQVHLKHLGWMTSQVPNLNYIYFQKTVNPTLTLTLTLALTPNRNPKTEL